MPAPVPRCASPRRPGSALLATASLGVRLRVGLLSGLLWAACAAPAQAQGLVRFTDADGVTHSYPVDKPVADPRNILYRFTDAQGIVHYYAEQVADREQLMASSADSLNHHGRPEPGVTDADPPFVRTMMAHPNAAKYDTLLSQAASEFGIDAALLKAVLTAESGFNASAVSSKGAIGLMQVMPATAERYGLQGDRHKTLSQKLTDPKINIRLAARYLRDLMTMFPQRAELAIASYNAGEGTVQKYGNKIPPYPETQGYVRLVSRFYQLYRPRGPVEITAGRNGGATAGNAARLKVMLPPHAPGTRQAEAPPPQAIAGTRAADPATPHD